MEKIILKNKKGDITVTMLVIGVFFVCTLAIVIFFFTSLSISDEYIKVGLIEKVKMRMERGDNFDGTDSMHGNFLKENVLVREKWWHIGKTKEIFYVKFFSP